MSRFYRWQIVLPRLLLVGVLLLAGQYGLGLMVRTAAIWVGEAALNSRVEVAHARVSLLDRQVVLGDIRVADPLRPSLNLLEADRCALDFAAKPLLHKQIIIEQGTVSGLRFGAPRGASGAHPGKAAGPVARSIQWFNDQAPKRAQDWLEHLDRRYDPDLINQFDSIKRTAALGDRLPRQWTELKRNVEELAARGERLRKSLDTALTNPLRHKDALDQVRGEISRLQRDFERVDAEVGRLPGLIETERRTIVALRHQDENWLREQLRVSAIDEEAMAAYLLSRQLAQPLDDAIGWLRFIRGVTPEGLESCPPRQQRGEEIFFAGCERTPQFLVRAVALHGAARVGGQPVEIRGRLSDFSSAPALHTGPVRLHLTATGSLSLVLDASIDRTRSVARDDIAVTCHGLVMPETCLGLKDQLQLVVAPSMGDLCLNITLEGTTLSGDVQFTQRKVKLTPIVGGTLRDASLAKALDTALNDVSELATCVSLRGTLDEPSCTLTSSLGPAVTNGLQVALQRIEDQHVRRLLAATQRQIDQQLAQIDRRMADEQALLQPQLSQTADQLKELAGQQKSPHRISKDQLGRRLPADSLFR